MEIPDTLRLHSPLDAVDKAIKAVAVLLGGILTYWNYRKSRTYKEKMELSLTGTIFRKRKVYVEVIARLKNLGAAQHKVQQEGTSCSIVAISEDFSETRIDYTPIFTLESYVEPGETITDRVLAELTGDLEQIIWLRVDLRVVSGSVEWHQSDLIRVPAGTGEMAAS